MYAYNTVPVIPSGIFKFCTLTSQLFIDVQRFLTGRASHPRRQQLCDALGGRQAGRSMDARASCEDVTTGRCHRKIADSP